MLKKMRIKKRLTVSFILVAVIASVAAIAGCIAMVYIGSSYAYALTNYGFAQGDIGNAMTEFAEERSASRAAIGYLDDNAISDNVQKRKDAKDALNKYLEQVELTLVTKAEQATYVELQANLTEYWKTEETVVNLGSTPDETKSKQAQTIAISTMDPLFEKTNASFAELMDLNVTTGNKIHNQLNILRVVLLVSILIVIALSLIVSTLLGAKIANGIAIPLSKLSDRLKSFAEGNLSDEFPEMDSNDEVADMVNEATSMADNLRDIINDAGYLLGEMAEGNYAIKSNMENRYVGEFVALIESMRKMNYQMSDTLKQIDEASTQVSSGSENLADAAQSLAEGATEQAGAIEELQATIMDISNDVEQTAEKVEASYKQARNYANLADKSQKEMESLVSAMEGINITSQKIGNIISDIENIATQTNLLSLNAAIEAARAGEAGKGFAVVADEIRHLAEQSANSAVDTRQLIENSLQEVGMGNQAAGRASSSMEEIIKGITEIAETSKDLSEISAKQAETMKQAEIGVQQISEVVQANSATAEESSATSQELSAQAVNLGDLVSRFKLR